MTPLRLASVVAFVVLPALALLSCASTPVYGPATSATSTGYTDMAIEANRYRVTYRGGDQALAREYALLRAAELTLASGAEWFRVISGQASQNNGYDGGPRVSVGGSVGSYGGRTATGIGLGIGFPIGGSSSGPATAVLEIVTGSGPKPEGPDVYDARQVADNIRARMGR